MIFSCVAYLMCKWENYHYILWDFSHGAFLDQFYKSSRSWSSTRTTTFKLRTASFSLAVKNISNYKNCEIFALCTSEISKLFSTTKIARFTLCMLSARPQWARDMIKCSYIIKGSWNYKLATIYISTIKGIAIYYIAFCQ